MRRKIDGDFCTKMEFKNSRNEDNWQNRLKNLKKEKT